MKLSAKALEQATNFENIFKIGSQNRCPSQVCLAKKNYIAFDQRIGVAGAHPAAPADLVVYESFRFQGRGFEFIYICYYFKQN